MTIQSSCEWRRPHSQSATGGSARCKEQHRPSTCRSVEQCYRTWSLRNPRWLRTVDDDEYRRLADDPADQSPLTSPAVQVRMLIALAGAKHCGDSSAIVERTRYVIQLVLCFLAAGRYTFSSTTATDSTQATFSFAVGTRAQVNYSVPTPDVGCAFTHSSL